MKKLPPAASHTPTPWRYADSYILGADDTHVINLHGAMGGNNPGDDIALVVKAVNAHEARELAALKLIKEARSSLAYLEANPDEYSNVKAPRLEDAIKAMEAALKKGA